MGVLRVYTLVMLCSTRKMSRERTINGQTKRTAHTGNYISAVHTPEYFQRWQYPR